jgi:Nucleotide-diphospho-sugar transferase
MSTGVIYVATGQQYIQEALISAYSLKEKMPNLKTTIFSDEALTDKCFDNCVVIESTGNGYLDKIVGMLKSPYTDTLFLDSDTYICDDFSELFTLLDKYDIGAIHAEHRAGKNQLGDSYSYQDLQDEDGKFIFPMYNAGVILYRQSPQVSQFFNEWFSLADRQMKEKGLYFTDQPAFQALLHQSNLREVILTPEYNCRFIFPVCISGIVKILHGRHPDLPALAKEINSHTTTRLFHPRWGLIPNSRLKALQQIALS